jgi:hypothetical protein
MEFWEMIFTGFFGGLILIAGIALISFIVEMVI